LSHVVSLGVPVTPTTCQSPAPCHAALEEVHCIGLHTSDARLPCKQCTLHSRPLLEAMSEAEDECCWLCLGEGKPVGAPLRQRCGCPRKSHAECLALWQLHSAGRRCAPARCKAPYFHVEADCYTCGSLSNMRRKAHTLVRCVNREETHCSFCQRHLRDWRLAFLDLPLALPVMTVRVSHGR